MVFGLFRTYLAVAVFASHILVIPSIGTFAVEGFFILSGYLMTLIMATTYGYTRQGIRTYAVNRALRLFPSYWVILLLTVGAILMLGEDASRAYRNTIYLPDTPWVWLQNITMIYADWNPQNIQPRLSPATWALTIELVFYALIGCGLFRSLRLTWIVVALGLGYQAYIVVTAVFDLARFPNFILSGALPFGIGGLLFHYRYQLARFSPGTTLTYALFIPAFALLGAAAIWLRSQGMGMLSNGLGYVNLLLCAAAVAALAQPGTRNTSAADRFIGDFSYHLYISHWVVAMVVANLLFGVSQPLRWPEGLMVFLSSAIICVVLSLMLQVLVDRPVETLRRRIKARTVAA